MNRAPTTYPMQQLPLEMITAIDSDTAGRSLPIPRLAADVSPLIRDGIETAKVVVSKSAKRTFDAWIVIPIGVTAVLATCFGVDRLISLGSVSFPASVTCMVLLFFALVLSSVTLGERTTKSIIRYIDVPCGWSLRYINVLVCPGFVVLPLSSSIGGVEVGKIIAVTIVGWIVVFCFSAYLVRGMVLILGESKKAVIARAEEMGDEDDAIPMTAPGNIHDSRRTSDSNVRTPAEPSNPSDLQLPPLAQDPDAITGTGGPPTPADSRSEPLTSAIRPTPILRHDALPRTRPEKWAATIDSHLDPITYTTLFLLIGLPVYYSTDYPMPAQLCINILTHQFAISLPLRWKQYLHPILLSSGLTILGIWILSLTHGETLTSGLHAYSTGLKYTKLWSGQPGLPGAGDMLSSIIDVSIISLALPMYQYRHELRKNFAIILLPNIVIAFASLFLYPLFCQAIGISPENSLAFASRCLTLALAQISVLNLGGNLNVGSPVAIFSGILGVLIGMYLLKKMRIPEDDYVTRGISLGSNASSLATAMLLTTDPRAAAFSSLSMGLFGTVMVAGTSIPPLVNIVRGLVGL